MHTTTTVTGDRQPRERAVQCRSCRRTTWNINAICDVCSGAINHGHDPATVTGASDARHDPAVWDQLDMVTEPPAGVEVA